MLGLWIRPLWDLAQTLDKRHFAELAARIGTEVTNFN
jgi:hypothetical protein